MTRPLTSVADLVDAGLVPRAAAPALDPVARDFRIRITPAMQASLGAPGMAAQFVPDTREGIIRPEERADPIGDAAYSPVAGLTHRYPDRAILHVTQTCAVYCRFCFRREVVGADGALSSDRLDGAVAYLARTPAIREVILTGGDPLTLSARRLADLTARLAAIPHLEMLRVHTRVPLVAPERMDAPMIAALSQTRLTPWVVIHTNHPDELTPDGIAALERLTRAGVPLLAQTVLLRGVNADADTLAALFRALLRHRVKPYYLHHADLARGTGHFRTTIAEGQAIMAALRGRVSGTALPTYVLDLPGGHGKVPLGPAPLHQTAPGRYLIPDRHGHLHAYADPGA